MEDPAFAALPLAYRRLEAAGYEDRDLLRLKGIYRNTWVRNTLLLERVRATADAIRSSQLPLLFVGTIGAAVRYYDTLGLRPTGYIELLVKQADWLRAVRALGRAGWSTRGAARPRAAEPLRLLDDAGEGLPAPNRPRSGLRRPGAGTRRGALLGRCRRRRPRRRAGQRALAERRPARRDRHGSALEPCRLAPVDRGCGDDPLARRNRSTGSVSTPSASNADRESASATHSSTFGGCSTSTSSRTFWSSSRRGGRPAGSGSSMPPRSGP